MSENNRKQRGGVLGKPVVLFFVFAVLCVVAFLIVILVKSCDADNEEKVEEQIMQEDVVLIPQTDTIQLLG